MAITSAEIAKICNVSRTTVDRALKGKDGINPLTKDKILAVAKEYNYRPNYIASCLSTGRTFSVGVIVFDLYNQHFTDIIDGIEQYFSNIGIHTYICISHKNKEREKSLLQSLIERKVDGILIVPINFENSFIDYVKSFGFPVVCLSNYLPGLPFVSGDNEGGVYMGMEKYYAEGYRNVYFVCPPLRHKGEQNIYAQESRCNGYLRFLNDHPSVHGSIISSKSYVDETAEIIRNSAVSVGIFCSSDVYMLNIAKKLSLEKIERTKYKLMGTDGLDVLDYMTSHPSSVFYPAKEIGRTGAAMLNDLINNNETATTITIPCTYIPEVN